MRAGGIAMTLAALVALASGCGKDETPTAPGGTGELPPNVTQVSPPARATQVPYDTVSIWAEFDAPLDSTSVRDENVYLKRDTQRMPIAVRWDAARRRIVIQPGFVLELLATYTVELSPNLRDADGDALGTRVQWQFTTNGLRRPSQPSPALTAVASSPFVTPGWGGNALSGGIVYEFYADLDSTAVANRTVPYRSRAIWLYHLPSARWPEGARVYWAVTAERLDTGERFAGPVWSFTTLPPGAQVDSIVVSAADYSWAQQGQNPTRCLGAELVSGPNWIAAFHPTTGLVPADLRVAGVRLEVSATAATEANLSDGASVWSATAAWACNTVRFGGPPFLGVPLAEGRRIEGTRTAAFASDALNAHFEAMVRRGDQFGYVLRSPLEVRWVTPQQGEPDKVIRMVVYRYTGAETLP